MPKGSGNFERKVKKLVNVDKIYILTYNSNIKETNTMSNLCNIKLNNWWNVWDKNHPYKFVVL